ncbi:unnamed protein product [Symbiodinium necroappetens]|uniref:Uncharacterized protein n=1 Tax=Symbiodinium necroappetens TaxID=1628268 RepID=A0A812Y8R4_9DINO|nr:unnamed protein product [Symbiodinium necroappetens]|mmetsp:Transcript_65027/g.155293  ORF Transcript_65027/g.155293 Transcript_65027/m.155293 type:complete len:211 (+) Transcript_65027:132-764(+)
MTASRCQDASEANTWGATQNFANGQVQENDVSKSRTTSSEESKAPILKDLLPSRSRWADIEVEDTFDEELYESDSGSRANPPDEMLAERRQLGPRGGRRPKFPVTAETKVHVQPPVKPVVETTKFEKSFNKPAPQQTWHVEAWGDWGYAGYDASYDASYWPSRADMDDSWRRRGQDMDEGWGYSRRGRDTGGDLGYRAGRGWGRYGRDWY